MSALVIHNDELSIGYFVTCRPYGTKPFDVTEDGEVEQLSVVKVTTWLALHIPF